MNSIDTYDRKNPLQANIIETRKITPEDYLEEAKHIVMEVEEDDFHFNIGQSIEVIVPPPYEYSNKPIFRLYSIASDKSGENGKKSAFAISVKRCHYIDEYNGEKYKGPASNYLCDLKVSDTIRFTGPYNRAFTVPGDNTANLLLIGLGTGISPFRAFIKHIYSTVGDWKGKVRLFYGAKTGLELLYMNDKKNDLAEYRDEETFKAFSAVSPKPYWDEPVDIERQFKKNKEEIKKMLLDNNTYVYIAGLRNIADLFDKACTGILGSEKQWEKRRDELLNNNRMIRILY
jgi:ferredoxin--NADP+ reductase